MANTNVSDFLLENRLRKLNPELHQRFADTVVSIRKTLFRFRKLFPEYTDHSGLHSMTVIDFCNRLIGPEQAERLNADSIYTLLMSCYRSVLDLARENHCTSVAIPLISAGAYGYPKAEAYLIATSVIREWLYKNRSDIEINLVLYDSDDAELGRSFDSGIKDYINAFYEWQHKEHIREYYEEREDRRSRRSQRITPRREAIHDDVAPDMAVSAKTAPAAPMASLPDESVWEAPKAYDKAAAPSASSAVLNYADQDLSFAEMCEWWCARKHIPKGKFYMDSNITRATFSGMKQNPGRMPKKTTVLACVIGLKLDLDQAKDLLLRAGLAFSKHYMTDVLVEKYIREGIYDIDLINLELYEHDQKQLGYSRGE